jgi:hypothetical protein
MDDMVHFDGDPATDSARRRLERVLKSEEPPPRWPWILAALGGGGVWLLWRLGRVTARTADASEDERKR